MILLSCLIILFCALTGRDCRTELSKLKSVDWKEVRTKIWNNIVMYVSKGKKYALESILKFWFVVEDPNISTFDKALLYGAIFYLVSPISLIPTFIFNFFGIVDEIAIITFVMKRIKDRITPEMESKVQQKLQVNYGN